ncbi:MAG: glutathione S-transferase family protein [Pseudomonadota bacterium]
MTSATGLTLYVHPFSSFSWKALIPLWIDDIPFTYCNVDPSNSGVMDELKAHWPLGKFPTLIDNGKVIAEATCIIEHLQAHRHGPTQWIPDGDEGHRVRFLDRFFDLHIQGNMQPTVNHAIWPDGEGLAAVRGREALQVAYDWLEANLRDEGWAVGDNLTLADCAAAPALFYSDWIVPIGDQRPRLASYRKCLLAHPAVKRAVEEARPYRHYFPLGAPDRD